MFRIIIGATLLVVGFFVMCAALAGTHGNPPTNWLRWETWLFWSMCVVPMGLSLWLLLGRSLRKLFR